MKKRNLSLALFLIFSILAFFSYSQGTQDKVDNKKVVGTWKIEVNAGNEYYYLTLEMKETEGKLEGKISEEMDRIKDAPISQVLFDGEKLSFEFTSPTPPDGLERVVKAEFKVGVDKMEGTMSVTEMGVSVGATAAREKS